MARGTFFFAFFQSSSAAAARHHHQFLDLQSPISIPFSPARPGETCPKCPDFSAPALSGTSGPRPKRTVPTLGMRLHDAHMSPAPRVVRVSSDHVYQNDEGDGVNVPTSRSFHHHTYFRFLARLTHSSTLMIIRTRDPNSLNSSIGDGQMRCHVIEKSSVSRHGSRPFDDAKALQSKLTRSLNGDQFLDSMTLGQDAR